MRLAKSPLRGVAFAYLLLAGGGLACADQANPVIPSTPGIPGGHVGGAGDAAVGEDAADTAPVARTDGATAVTCDLLKQDCPASPISSLPQACYPEGGIGRCETIGDGKPAFAPCDVNTDCSRGLACITPCGYAHSECQPLCDVADPLGATDCADGQVCKPFSGTGNAGYCWTPC
jgi:hypothetical protein